MSAAVQIKGSTELRADLARFVDELPLAYAKALTFLAQDAQKAIKNEMATAFDRPTPYALNSLFVTPATVAKPVSKVSFKSESSTGDVPATRFMGPGVSGGMRGHKRAERALQYRGILTSTQTLIPAKTAPTDAYGNVSGNLITQMLASLTGSALLRGKRVRGEWFVMYENDKPAFIARMSGRTLQTMFIIVDKSPRYRVRLRFWETGRDISARNFSDIFGRQVDSALAKMRV